MVGHVGFQPAHDLLNVLNRERSRRAVHGGTRRVIEGRAERAVRDRRRHVLRAPHVQLIIDDRQPTGVGRSIDHHQPVRLAGQGVRDVQTEFALQELEDLIL